MRLFASFDRGGAKISQVNNGSAAAGTKLRSGRLCRGSIDIGTDHRCAFTPESEGARSADTAPRTRNQRDLPFDTPHTTLPAALSAIIEETPNARSSALLNDFIVCLPTV